MPTYDLPIVPFYPDKEKFIRTIHEPIGITSILDVGAGHGGVFDYGYWDGKPSVDRREACDIFWIREMSPRWSVKTGVDVHELTKHYAPKSFDLVQCMETLEHVDNPRQALDQLCAVAKKVVIITSADEMHHQGEEQAAIEKINKHQAYKGQPSVKDLNDLGFEVRVDNNSRRQLIAWKIMYPNR